MKKIIIILGILMCFSLTGCASLSDTFEGEKNYDVHSHLILIEGENDLYYYSTTHIVYIVFNEVGISDRSYGYMAPYYSENGKLCVYDVKAKKLIELEDK